MNIARVVIIGNGVAGTTAADCVRQASPRCQVDVIAREIHHHYNRMALGRAVYGRTAMTGLYLLQSSWWEQKRINVWLNTAAARIDATAKTVLLATGDVLPFDRLILAPGAKAVIPALPGAELRGCFVLREAEDALQIRSWSQKVHAREAIVAGGGVLGIEAADALRQLGLRVTILQRSCHLMNRNLDEKGSRILERFLAGLGIDVLLGAELEGLSGDRAVSAVHLRDGRTLPAQICLICAGVQPNIALAKRAGLAIQRGIMVDRQMRTSNPDVFAIGDVSEIEGHVSELWTVGAKQAAVAVSAMFGKDAHFTAGQAPVQLKVDGIDVKAFGPTVAAGPYQRELVDPEEPDNLHRKILIERNLIIGATFVGPPGTARDFASLADPEADNGPLLTRLEAGDWQIFDEFAA